MLRPKSIAAILIKLFIFYGFVWCVMCKIIPNEEIEKDDNEASTERISRYDNISESDSSAQRDAEANTEEEVEVDPQESNIESGNEEESETRDESLGFEDIAQLRRCIDPETGHYYKEGATWISPNQCVRMVCREEDGFLLLHYISCVDFFKDTKPEKTCKAGKRTFPNCCDECKKSSHVAGRQGAIKKRAAGTPSQTVTGVKLDFQSRSASLFLDMEQRTLIHENEAMTDSTASGIEATASYWKNNGSEPLKNLTIGRLIDESFPKHENRTAIKIHQGPSLTFGQAYEKILDFASGLVALGLQKGDHVGIWAPNIIEWYISVLAVMKAGFVAVNLNPFYECPELEWALKNMDVKALIIGDAINGRNFYEMIKKIIPDISNYNAGVSIHHCDTLPALKYLISASSTNLRGAYRWCDICSMGTRQHREKLQQMENEINVHDTCNIQFSSGTTGTSKGACLSHYNLVNNSYYIAKGILLLEKPHSICLQVPFFHTFGTGMGILAHVNSGATIVSPSVKFSPTQSIEAIIAEECTVLYGTPTMYHDLVSIVEKKSATDPTVYSKLSSLEIALTSGAICNVDLFKKMKNTFNFKHIFSAYGMTEVSPIHFLSKPDDDETLITTTIGYPMEHTETKVIGEDGRMVPFGVPGECCFKGYNVMKGYYNDPEKTRQAFLDNGWIRSGDRFILLKNGYGQVVGRIKDTITRGGENIEPSEIEDVLIEHPEIINVQVYGVSDERLGEVVAASIIRIDSSRLNEDDVRKFFEGKLASYKIPKYIRFVDEFPKTASGKVQKIRLRDALERELGLKENV